MLTKLTNLCVVAARQLIMVKLPMIRYSFGTDSEHLGITTLTGKFFKTPKKSAIFDHILLDGHKVNFDNFSILLKERNGFNYNSLLISSGKPILNKNVYSFPLEMFDWLEHNYFYYIYCYLCDPVSVHHLNYRKIVITVNCHSFIMLLVEVKAYLWW